MTAKTTTPNPRRVAMLHATASTGGLKARITTRPTTRIRRWPPTNITKRSMTPRLTTPRRTSSTGNGILHDADSDGHSPRLRPRDEGRRFKSCQPDHAFSQVDQRQDLRHYAPSLRCRYESGGIRLIAVPTSLWPCSRPRTSQGVFVVTAEEWVLAETVFFSGIASGLLGMLCTI